MKLTSFSRAGYLLAACLGLTLVSSLSAQPYGWFDSMSPSGTDVTVTTTISGNGWAADDVYGAPVQRIEIRVDGNTVLNATLGDDRSDVAAVFGRSDFTYSGFHFSYSAGNLSTGSHTFSAVAFNPAGQSSQLGNTFSVNVLANRAPSPGISVDGHSPGDTITRPYGGSAQVTVRYTASDPDGNLQGIRYNIWNATTGYFNNGGGGFVGTGGNSGEVDQTVTLDSDGDWYFWTDAQDTMNAYASTGDWTNGFHIVVNQAPAPNHQPVVNWVSVSPSELAPGETVTITANVSDQDNNLSEVYFYVNAPPYNGWQQLGAVGVSGSNQQPSWNYTVPSGGPTGTYIVTARVHDTDGAWDVDDTNADRTTFTVNPPPKSPQPTVYISPSSTSVTQGGSITFSASGGSGSGAYQWGGDAGGSGSSTTVTFNTTGTRYVTVYRQGDANYNDSNTATATITVNAPPPPTYTLTVQNGSGSQSGLTAGSVVTISANGPPSGYTFSGWSVSGPGSIGNAGASSTTFTMGSGNATVTANYAGLPPPINFNLKIHRPN